MLPVPFYFSINDQAKEASSDSTSVSTSRQCACIHAYASAGGIAGIHTVRWRRVAGRKRVQCSAYRWQQRIIPDRAHKSRQDASGKSDKSGNEGMAKSGGWIVGGFVSSSAPLIPSRHAVT